ncbi:hypothetical protein DK870_24860 [Pseudomonas sp. Q1]|nr:hypothetical protein [Pseudomonas sp. Q1]
MREVTIEEAEAVVGAYGVPGAIGGAAAGATAYVGGLIGGASFSAGELMAAVGSGALGGAIMGPASIGRTLASAGVAFTGGVIVGNAGRLTNGS